MRIEVTKEHIEDGEKDSKFYCPIALAMKDAGYDRPCVGALDVSWFIGKGDWNCAGLPTDAAQFVEDFDDGLNVEPFEFDLEVLHENQG